MGRRRQAVGHRAAVHLQGMRQARRGRKATLRRCGSPREPHGAGLMPDWSREFEDPFPMPSGHEINTLRDAGEYIAGLPRQQQDQACWHTAAEMLLMAAESRRPVMFARIAMLRALNHGKPATPPPERHKAAKKYKMIR
jgi:hypothetical protein